jgi:hypothetical protein
MEESSRPSPAEKVYDLNDVVEEGTAPPPGELIYELTDMVDKRPKVAFADPGLREEIIRVASEIAEQIAREVIPVVAERVIREEINKLKAQQQNNQQ